MEEAAPAAPSSPLMETGHFPARRLATRSFSLARLGLLKLSEKPVVRWAGLVVALGATVWVLYPYFLALGLFLDRRPGGGSPSMAFPDVVDVGVVVDAGAHGAGQRPPFGLDEPIFVGMDHADWVSRREKVKAAYQHALTGYMDHAFPNDELAPLTGTYTNKSVVAFLFGPGCVLTLSGFWCVGSMDGACR